MMHQLSESEIKHIDVCIQIINEAIEELGQEVKHIPEMVS
jgi:serine/threonine-protein kinase HipA